MWVAVSCWILLLADGPEVPLWQLDPFDRVTLSNDDVHDIEPERIPPGTNFDSIPDDSYVGQPGLPPRPEIKRSLKYRIRRKDDGQEYDVYGRFVRRIDLYEQMLLDEAKRLLRLDRFDECFPYLVKIASRQPDFPGLDRLRVEYAHREGTRQKLAGQWELAYWRLLEAERGAAILAEPIDLAPPPDQQIEDLVDRWIQSNIDRGNFLEARRIIGRVESTRPASAAAPRRKAELIDRAQALREQAQGAIDGGDKRMARALLEEALAVAPTEETLARLDEVYRAQGHLKVGVEQPASFLGGPAVWTTADERVAWLVHRPLVTLEEENDGPVRWTSDILASIVRPEASLNRRGIIKIRSDWHWPTDGKPVTIVDVHRLFEAHCRPGSPLFHPALARLIARMEPTPPDTLVIDFTRPQPRLESWFSGPMLRVAHGGQGSFTEGLGPYTFADRKPEFARYVVSDDSSSIRTPVITQITETLVIDAAERLRAMEENRIDIATDLPPRQWNHVTSIPGTRLVARKTPTVYVLQFQFGQRVLRDRTLRRAIDYAIDRAAILQSLGFTPESASPRTACWPAGSFGEDSSIKPRPLDRILAKTLVTAVRKKFSTLPVLRLMHEANSVDREACDRIVQQLGLIGLQVTRVEFDPRTPASLLGADLRYVGLTPRDPIYDTMTFLTRDNPSLADHASPTLRQLLVELVDVPNLAAARDLFPRLHRVLHDDVAILPLWQTQRRWAISDRVSGIKEKPESTYEGIAEWHVRPGLPPLGWETGPLAANK